MENALDKLAHDIDLIFRRGVLTPEEYSELMTYVTQTRIEIRQLEAKKKKRETIHLIFEGKSKWG